MSKESRNSLVSAVGHFVNVILLFYSLKKNSFSNSLNHLIIFKKYFFDIIFVMSIKLFFSFSLFSFTSFCCCCYFNHEKCYPLKSTHPQVSIQQIQTQHKPLMLPPLHLLFRLLLLTCSCLSRRL